MPNRFLCAAFLFLLLLGSCNPCGNLDCISGSYYAQFRITAKTDGRDLVFGSSAIYDKSEIKFYTITGTDTSFFLYEPLRFSHNLYDSILYVHFIPEAKAPVYMQLNSTDTDTLLLTYRTYDSRCCGNITEIVKFRYNNTVDIPGNQGTQELQK